MPKRAWTAEETLPESQGLTYKKRKRGMQLFRRKQVYLQSKRDYFANLGYRDFAGRGVTFNRYDAGTGGALPNVINLTEIPVGSA